MSGKLEKMLIEGYISPFYVGKAMESYSVMFNPTTYSRQFKARYFDTQALGESEPKQVFNKVDAREYSFEFLFDGTGTSAPKTSVSDELDAFFTVCGKVTDNLSRPMFLKLSWGDLLVKCILKSADVSYTLFTPDGKPLRAKASCTFQEYQSDLLNAAIKGIGGEKLSQAFEVTGDNKYLSSLAKTVYDDPALYMEVAAANGLAAIRQPLKGLNLNFPPLK
ncbi:MAG: hypothetical protein ACFB10_10095 [Salibacteraceae bacterium]